MEKLMVSTLEQDDFQYITDYPAYEKRLAVYNAKIHDEGYQEAWDEASMKYEPIIEMQNLKIKQAEQEKQKAEQEKQKAEQALLETQMHLIKKMLKKGDSETQIMELLEIDKPTFDLLLKKIKESGISILPDKKE